MKNKALISVTSSQNVDENSIEVVTPGKFYKKDDIFYAVYKETEISGMKGTTTTLKIKDDEVKLIRVGTTRAKMNFIKNLKDISLYDTPYGALEIIVDTIKLKIDVNENGGNINIYYNMTLEGQETIKTSLDIKIKLQE